MPTREKLLKDKEIAESVVISLVEETAFSGIFQKKKADKIDYFVNIDVLSGNDVSHHCKTKAEAEKIYLKKLKAGEEFFSHRK